MTGFATLFLRELRRRRLALGASLAIGTFAALTPYLDGTAPSHATELRGIAALVTTILWSLLYAIGTGATLFARPLADRHLGFDFRLPVSGRTIWAAEVAAAFFTVLGVAALTLLPSLLFGSDLDGATGALDFALKPDSSLPPSNSAFVLLTVVLPAVLAMAFLLGNLAGMAFLAKQPWAGLDLLAFAGYGLATWLVTARLTDFEAPRTAGLVLSAAVALLPPILAIAWLLQVARGRTEPDRAARAATTTLLLGSSGLIAVGAVVLAWALRPSLDDVVVEHSSIRPVGSRWVSVIGPARLREPVFRFLVDARTGRWRRLGSTAGLPLTAADPQAAPNEKWIGWIERASSGSFDRAARLVTIEASDVQAPRRETRIEWSTVPRGWAISPDARTIASLVESSSAPKPESLAPKPRLLLHDLDSRARPKELEVPDCSSGGRVAFLASNYLRVACGLVHSSEGSSLGTYDADLSVAPVQWIRSGALDDLPLDRNSEWFERSGRRLVAVPGDQRWDPPPALLLTDVAMPREPARLLPPEGMEFVRGVYGSWISDDGSVAAFVISEKRTRLALYGTDGTLQRVANLPLPWGARIVAESVAGKLVVSPPRETGGLVPLRPLGEEFLLVDRRTGSVESLPGVVGGPMRASVRFASFLARGEGGRWLWFDPESGRLETLHFLDPASRRRSWFSRSTGQIESTTEGH